MKIRDIVFIIVLACISASAFAVSPMLTYQGKILQPSGEPVTDGVYKMQFAIYDVAADGTALWSEPQNNVVVKGGLFSVMLGSVNPFPEDLFDSSERYFGLSIGNDLEMTPRQKMGSTTSALVSRTVINGAITTQKIADSAVTTEKIADGSITSEKLVPGAAIASGLIVMWSGAISEIPAGWALCDGQNGTPDLRDKFIVGSGSTYTTGATGGSAVVNLAHSHIINDHSHNANHSHGADPVGDHTHHLDLWTGVGPQRANYYTYKPDGYNEIHDDHTHQVVGDTWGAGGHSHTIQSANFNTAGASDRGTDTKLSSALDIRPPYYALAFIMKK